MGQPLGQVHPRVSAYGSADGFPGAAHPGRLHADGGNGRDARRRGLADGRRAAVHGRDMADSGLDLRRESSFHGDRSSDRASEHERLDADHDAGDTLLAVVNAAAGLTHATLTLIFTIR
jgi:hypothetical protein